MVDLGYCSQFIPDSMWGHKCSCKATVIEAGKPYCTRHSKAGKEKQKVKSDAKYQAKYKEIGDKWKRESVLVRIAGGFSTELLESHIVIIRDFIEALKSNKVVVPKPE